MNSMIRNLAKIFCLMTYVFISTPSIAADSNLQISGEKSSQECKDAFHLAQSMFYSKSHRLYAPLSIPNGMQSEMVLGTSTLDISGGDELIANEEIFEKIPLKGEERIRSLYWGLLTNHGKRVVVREEYMGWQGDRYALYLIDADVTQDDFLTGGDDAYEQSLVLGYSWRPPLVFLSKANHKLWFIDVGEPHEILANWSIYSEKSNALKTSCVIKFHGDEKNIIAVLPKSVLQLANLLDQTLGTGQGEGSLQQTARLRLDVQHIWANTALRPWSLSESNTYNSTKEVQSGLERWSRNGPTFKKVYKKILITYPIAENDLAHYYTGHFHLPKDKALSLAKWVLDITYRAHFVFPNGGDYFRYDEVNTNPWNDDYKDAMKSMK